MNTMIKDRRWLIAILCIYLTAGAALTALVFTHNRPAETDVVALNRILNLTISQWPGQDFQEAEHCPYDYAVIGLDGTPLYQTDPQVPIRIADALRSHDAVMDIVVQEKPVGHIIFSTGFRQLWDRQQKQLAAIMAGMFFLFLLSAFCCIRYLEHRIFLPFARLKAFARHIAMGNLDVPLPMDEGHVFGAFTESFDLMREQLSQVRQKEAEADQSKKELAASLSHDIKTPVTSIKLISELLLVTEDREPVREKLQTIYHKSEQIDLLITNMLHSALEDLGKLKVRVSEESSQILEPMIRQADLYHQVIMAPIPGCLILSDPLRMEQVIDNIISNAYKYADTSITVLSEVIDGFLRLEFMDYGPGVPEEELPLLFQKFFRGSHGPASSKQGSGLGLYIARHLMNAMHGEIQYFNRPDGFSVEILIPLVQR